MTPKEGDLKVYHYINVDFRPVKSFERKVKSIEEARAVLNLLADYDLFLGDLIESNAQGLLVYEAGEWSDWMDEFGYTINESQDAWADLEVLDSEPKA
jgi:hypothetical protein